MNPVIFKYLITSLFVVATFWLSYKGMKKTKDIKSFSVGNGDMSPYLIGITMAASVASTATFVINPGFVYIHGFSAYLHYAVAGGLGILVAFITLTKGVRKLGEKSGALTIPDWIFHRYGSRPLALFFAFTNLLSITFVVLILVGCSMLMGSLFDISQKYALVITLLFVFSYVLMGGTYAHAYTNTFQGIMMIFVALFLFTDGLLNIDGHLFAKITEVSTSYASILNPESTLYSDFFSVFVSGFVITFALMLQPHILTKVFYLKSEKDIKKFIGTTTVVGFIFTLMLFVGFFARLKGLEIVRQDAVVIEYIKSMYGGVGYGPYLLIFISLTLLAAGMSTLDGILVALSSMVVNDIYMPLNKSSSMSGGLKLSRYVLILIGLISFLLAWNPPQLVGLFAQKGIYGLAAATVVPILFGVFIKREIPVWIITCAALIGLFGHLLMNMYLGILNPAVSSTYAIFISILFSIVALAFSFKFNNNDEKEKLKGGHGSSQREIPGVS